MRAERKVQTDDFDYDDEDVDVDEDEDEDEEEDEEEEFDEEEEDIDDDSEEDMIVYTKSVKPSAKQAPPTKATAAVAAAPTEIKNMISDIIDGPFEGTLEVVDSRLSKKKNHDFKEFMSKSAEIHPDFFAVNVKDFGSLGVSPVLCEALQKLEVATPSVIQARSIPPLSSGISAVIGAATGSGKTLTYLLPLFMKLKNEELMRVVQKQTENLDENEYADDLGASGAWRSRKTRRPRALILCPTRELAQQVFEVAKHLSHFEKLRIVSLLGGSGSLKKQKDALSQAPVDIVISTTGRLIQHMDENNIDLFDCSTIVIDEVDTMFDKGFGPELERIIGRANRRRAKLAVEGDGGLTNMNAQQFIQFIAVGATHPKAAEELYEKNFHNPKRIEADLHRTPPGLLQRFVNVKTSDKTIELLALLGNSQAEQALRGGRMILFTNTIDSCRFVDHFLQEHGFTTSCIHGAVPTEQRLKNFTDFKEARTQILVCTDIAARGLDNLSVDHVVMFDFPTTAVDYLHRAGRTARAGRRGVVTSLVTKRDITLARVMEASSRSKDDALRKEAEKRKADRARARVNEAAEKKRKADMEARRLTGETGTKVKGGDVESDEEDDNTDRTRVGVRRPGNASTSARRSDARSGPNGRRSGPPKEFGGARSFRSSRPSSAQGRGKTSRGGAASSGSRRGGR